MEGMRMSESKAESGRGNGGFLLGGLGSMSLKELTRQMTQQANQDRSAMFQRLRKNCASCDKPDAMDAVALAKVRNRVWCVSCCLLLSILSVCLVVLCVVLYFRSINVDGGCC